MRFRDIPQHPQAHYEVDIPWGYLEDWISRMKDVDLDPDFQRAHVWTEEQQQAYLMWCVSGGTSGRVLTFNHPGANRGWSGAGVLVDGKQRLEAVRKFLRDELVIFGQVCSQFGKAPGLDRTYSFHMVFGNLKTRAEVLTWYLLFNSGGTDHTAEELARVQALLDKEDGNR